MVGASAPGRFGRDSLSTVGLLGCSLLFSFDPSATLSPHVLQPPVRSHPYHPSQPPEDNRSTPTNSRTLSLGTPVFSFLSRNPSSLCTSPGPRPSSVHLSYLTWFLPHHTELVLPVPPRPCPTQLLVSSRTVESSSSQNRFLGTLQ